MDPNNNQTPNEPATSQPQAEPVTGRSFETQPAPADSNFQQPATPVTTQPTNTPVVGGPNKNNLKLPIILGGALLLLALLGLVIWYSVFNVTKDDYKKADTAISEMKTVYNTAGDKMDDYMSELMSSYSTESEVKDAKDDFDKAYNDYKTKVTAIKDQKALRDGDVKKSYDEFEAQNKKFAEAVDGLIAVAPALKDAQTECGSSGISSTISSATPDTLVDKYDEAVKGCKDAAVKISESKVEPIANYGKKAVAGIEKMRTYMEKMQVAAKNNDRSAFQNAYYDMMDDEAVKAMSESGMSELNDLKDEVEVKDKLNAFADLVAEKAK